MMVGAVILKNNNLLKGIKDSKKLSFQKREEWFRKIENWQKENKLQYVISSVNSQAIDKFGISKCLKTSIDKCLKKLKVNSDQSLILLDGGLKAGNEYKNQKTIIQGDDKETIISCASIVAKVIRDRVMINYSKKFPNYNFEKHKGYGTKNHFECLKKHGPCPLHRRSFLKKFNKLKK